jgi:heat shock protein HslJ
MTSATFAGDLEFVGTTWQWRQTLLNENKVIAPSEPTQYTLTFGEDRTVTAQVDCNQMAGQFTRKGASIAIELTHGTRAMCPPDSLDIEFQREVAEARQMFIDASGLHLDLAGHRGTMSFDP